MSKIKNYLKSNGFAIVLYLMAAFLAFIILSVFMDAREKAADMPDEPLPLQVTGSNSANTRVAYFSDAPQITEGMSGYLMRHTEYIEFENSVMLRFSEPVDFTYKHTAGATLLIKNTRGNITSVVSEISLTPAGEHEQTVRSNELRPENASNASEPLYSYSVSLNALPYDLKLDPRDYDEAFLNYKETYIDSREDYAIGNAPVLTAEIQVDFTCSIDVDGHNYYRNTFQKIIIPLGNDVYTVPKPDPFKLEPAVKSGAPSNSPRYLQSFMEHLHLLVLYSSALASILLANFIYGFIKNRKTGETERILNKYSDCMVFLKKPLESSGKSLVYLISFEEIHKLAMSEKKPISCIQKDSRAVFYLETGGTVYHYYSRGGTTAEKRSNASPERVK